MKDPHIPDRMVSAKSANQPFLMCVCCLLIAPRLTHLNQCRHKEYRDRQEALHTAWLEKKAIRDAKLAKGEPVGPLEPDPTAPKEVGVLGLLKFFVYVLLFGSLAGKFITGSYTWEYEARWMQLKTLWPVSSTEIIACGGLIGR